MSIPVFIKFATSLVNIKKRDDGEDELERLTERYDDMGIPVPQDELDAVDYGEDDIIESFVYINPANVCYVNPTDLDDGEGFVYTQFIYANGSQSLINEPLENVLAKFAESGVNVYEEE